MQQLLLLGALKPSDGTLTELGRRMASLPLEPMYAKLLIDSDQYGCVAEVKDDIALRQGHTFLLFLTLLSATYPLFIFRLVFRQDPVSGGNAVSRFGILCSGR